MPRRLLLVGALIVRLASGCGGNTQTPQDMHGVAVPDPGMGGVQGVFTRADYPVSRPESIAVADLDGKNGPDIVVALPIAQAIGVLLNNGDGTFGQLVTYPACADAISIALGDVTTRAGTFAPGDGMVDAVVACASPDVGVLAGNGDGTFATVRTYWLGVAPPLVGPGDTPELIRLAHLIPQGPLQVVIQTDAGHGPRHLCVTVDFNPDNLSCAADADGEAFVAGPLVVGPFDPVAFPDRDVLITGGGDRAFKFFAVQSTGWVTSTRDTGGLRMESGALGDLNGDGYPDLLMGHVIDSFSDLVPNALTFHLWNPSVGIPASAVPGSLSSIPGLDAIAIADLDGDGHNDILGIGSFGRGVVHLGDGKGQFDSGRDVPLIGYRNPATATRTSLALGDFDCDGDLDATVSDTVNNGISVLLNGPHASPPVSCRR